MKATTAQSRTRRFRSLALVGVVALASVAAACSNDTQDVSSSDGATTTTEAMRRDSTTTTDAMGMASMKPSGPGCSAVPASGAGSFSGMAQDPAATAASNNPVLSTLVAAVKAAGLVDTLNGPGPFTIFAPTNDAFNKIPKATLDGVLADVPTLTKILTLHVVSGEKLSSEDLVKKGSVKTVQGQELTFAPGANGAVMVNGQATTVCANVQIANATVHIIDSVLMPS